MREDLTDYAVVDANDPEVQQNGAYVRDEYGVIQLDQESQEVQYTPGIEGQIEMLEAKAEQEETTDTIYQQ